MYAVAAMEGVSGGPAAVCRPRASAIRCVIGVAPDLVCFRHLDLNDRFAGSVSWRDEDRRCARFRFRRRRRPGNLWRGRRHNLYRGLAEGALELVQRHFAGAQFALQNLRHQRAFCSIRSFHGGDRRRHNLETGLVQCPLQIVGRGFVCMRLLGRLRRNALFDQAFVNLIRRHGIYHCLDSQ